LARGTEVVALEPRGLGHGGDVGHARRRLWGVAAAGSKPNCGDVAGSRARDVVGRQGHHLQYI
jgi:hypothetical protein